MSDQMLTVLVWRGTADKGRYIEYKVRGLENHTVLDVVTYIQRYLEPTLSYRFSCRVGMCGSCAMTVNGKPRWTCRSSVSKVAPGGKLKIAPLRSMKTIKDLSVDMSEFFDKLARAEGRFHPTSNRQNDFNHVKPDSVKRRLASDGIECIGCGICYASCDLVAWKSSYLGPAALNRAWTLVNDVRDGAHRKRLNAVAGDAGCHACHSQQGCVESCPKNLNPTASIAGLKRVTAIAALKGELD